MAIIIPEVKKDQNDTSKLRRAIEKGSVLFSALVMVILLAQHEQALNNAQHSEASAIAHYSVIAD